MSDIRRSASKELAINTIIFGVGTLGAKFVMLLLMPVYTTYLSTSELGVGELVVNSMNLIYPIATFNILSALLRYGMEKENKKEQVFQNTIVIVMAGMLFAGIVLHFIHMGSSIEQWKGYLFLLLISYAMEQIAAVFSKALDRNMDFAIGNILYTMSLFIISIILIKFMNRGTAGYLESIIIGNLLTCAYYFFRLKLYQYFVYQKLNRVLFKSMLLFSIPLICNSISWWIASFCDRFFLEYYIGTDAVGIYSAASKIPAVVTAVSAVFMQAWVLSAIKEYQKDSSNSFFSSVFRKYCAAFVVWAAIIICICKPFVQMVNRGDFSESWEFVPLLICAVVFSGFSDFFSAFYTSAKKNNAILITTLIGAVINIILNIVFIPKWGIQGAVLATMISQFVMALYRMINSQKFIEFKISYFKFILSIVLLCIEAVLTIYEISMLASAVILIIIVLLYYKEFQVIMSSGLSWIKRVQKH